MLPVAPPVMLDLVGNSYRRRVALEWRAAVVVAGAAMVVTVLGRLPAVGDGLPLLLGLAALIVLIALGLAANAWRRPVVMPPPPARWRDRDLKAVQKQVTRGKPMDPPELQTAAIGEARRGLRITHLNVGIWPAMGSSYSLRIGEGGFVGGFGYFGIVLVLLGAGVLVWSGVVQARLDRLENAAAMSQTDGDRSTGTSGAAA